MLRIIEDGLYQRLEGGVACLEIVNVFFIYALPAMVRVGVVDTICAVYRGAGRAARSIPIALMFPVD